MTKKIAIINRKCYERKIKSNEYIIERLNKDLEAEIVFTEYAGHAAQIAKTI